MIDFTPIMTLDLKIANFLKKILNTYINRRTNQIKDYNERKWNERFKGEDKFKGKLLDGLMMYYYRDSILSKLIYSGFENKEINFVRRYLKESDIFLDIGANIGLFSLHAAYCIGSSGKIIAFEPTPLTYARLVENIDLNNYMTKIIPVNIGLSEKKECLILNSYGNGYDAWNTFAKPLNEFQGNEINVQVDTLDNYLRTCDINIENISLIKVDVEGWEVNVIKGAVNTLKSKNAPTLLVEFTEEYAFAAGTSCYELYDLIKSYGYEWYIYDDRENNLKPEPKRLHYPYTNLIAIKDIEKAQMRISK
jgi:FkbM family methyltransferase